jgi:ribosomal protein L20A (L18A)
MAAITFDTLAYAKKLKAAGFTEEQAEVQAETQREAIEVVVSELEARHLKDMATKSDVATIRSDMATKDGLRKVEIEIAVVKWMLGTVIGGIVALLFKAFLK